MIWKVNVNKRGRDGGLLLGTVETARSSTSWVYRRRCSQVIQDYDENAGTFNVGDLKPLRIGRTKAFRPLEGRWDDFLHVWDVPGLSERLECNSNMGLEATYPTNPSTACSVGRTYEEENGFKILETRGWLIDSGSAWDLVQKGSVSQLGKMLRTPQYSHVSGPRMGC